VKLAPGVRTTGRIATANAKNAWDISEAAGGRSGTWW
jgi:hypothetical protein